MIPAPELLNSSPQTPIKRPILHGFRQMIRLDSGRCGEIGNRPRYLQNSIISPGTQVKGDHRLFQQFDTLLIQRAMLSQLSGCHSGVTGHPALATESFELKKAGTRHALADRRRIFFGRCLGQVLNPQKSQSLFKTYE
jgi:hypothetical protein